MAWTDERLDDLSQRMDAGFERTERDMRGLREEISGLRGEMYTGFSELRGEIRTLQLTMMRLGGGMLVTLLGVIASILATGG